MAFSNTNVSVGSSSTSVAAANGDRKYLRIQNDSDEIVYLAVGATAVSNKGVRLAAAGGVFEISREHGNMTPEVVNGICASGGKNVVVLERSN